MKITKNYLGTKSRIWLLFLSISLLFGIFSCSKTISEPKEYEIRIQNNYFEAISVAIGGHFLENLPKEALSKGFFLPKGKHSVTCITKSRLKIENSITLQGNRKQIVVEITPKGIILVTQKIK